MLTVYDSIVTALDLRLVVLAAVICALASFDQAAAIVRSALGQVRALRRSVLAEGGETTAELKVLESELCDEAQGNLLGRPGDIAGFRQLTHGVDADGDSTIVSLVPKASSTHTSTPIHCAALQRLSRAALLRRWRAIGKVRWSRCGVEVSESRKPL